MGEIEAVVALDTNRNVIGLNHVAETVFDLAAPVADASADDVFATHPEFLDKLTSDAGVATKLTLPLDGELREFELIVTPLSSARERDDETEAAIERVAVLRDLTERGEQKRDLELYQTLVEESPDAFTHIQPDGTMAYVNDSEEIVGRSAEEFINEPLERFIHPDDKMKANAFFEDLLSGADSRVQARFERGDSTWMWLETTGTNVTDSSVIDGAVTISRDITDRKQREQQLERQNERLDRFATVVSHDLRNPLTVASGYAEMAQETGDNEAFNGLHEALDRMEGMIEKLLVLARSETMIKDTKSVSLSERARIAWETTDTPRAELMIDDPQDLTFDADPELLTHVLENLFRNATDHNEPPLLVTVGVLERDDSPVGFCVEDDGRGIAPADRQSVFDHGHTTRGEGGGFGLSIVNEFIDAHGWEVTVTEGSDGGARFEILTKERS